MKANARSTRPAAPDSSSLSPDPGRTASRTDPFAHPSRLLVGSLGLALALALSLTLSPSPASAQAICHRAVQGNVAWDGAGDTDWERSQVRRLCRGARNSEEPARCFETVMSGSVDYGGGNTRWNPNNALRLCQGTRNASGLLLCFRRQIEDDVGWQEAIPACRQREEEGRLPSVAGLMDPGVVARAMGSGREGAERGGTDQDGDGHASVRSGGDDCDDTDPRRFPGNTEVGDRDGHDEDCDPTTFAYAPRDDGDGDGFFPDHFYNEGSGGRVYAGKDCDDTDPSVHAHGQEVCNGVDDDCDGRVDEDLRARVFRDADGDLFGDPARDARMCFHEVASPWVLNGTDCNDKDPTVNPGAGNCGQ